jgi:hypothetical protein
MITPCSCGFEICFWCWHTIKTERNGQCPVRIRDCVWGVWHLHVLMSIFSLFKIIVIDLFGFHRAAVKSTGSLPRRATSRRRSAKLRTTSRRPPLPPRRRPRCPTHS